MDVVARDTIRTAAGELALERYGDRLYFEVRYGDSVVRLELLDDAAADRLALVLQLRARELRAYHLAAARAVKP